MFRFSGQLFFNVPAIQLKSPLVFSTSSSSSFVLLIWTYGPLFLMIRETFLLNISLYDLLPSPRLSMFKWLQSVIISHSAPPAGFKCRKAHFHSGMFCCRWTNRPPFMSYLFFLVFMHLWQKHHFANGCYCFPLCIRDENLSWVFAG